MSKDKLSIGVDNLSAGEFKSFKKKISDNPKKMELLMYLRNEGKKELDPYTGAAKHLGYTKNKNAFYTLKHRLLEDFIDYKIEAGKNDLVKTRKRVWNLRAMLYSKDFVLLDRELNELFKKCTAYHLYNEIYEIYFIRFLLNYERPDQRVKYEELMEQARLKQRKFNRLENLFYRLIFDLDSWFYFSGMDEVASEIEDKKNILEEIECLHKEVDSEISLFLYLSSRLTLELQLFPSEDTSWMDIANDVEELKGIYTTPSVHFHYPNCQFGIQTLFSKFYLIHEDDQEFSINMLELRTMVEQVKGMKVYENVFSYFIFAGVYQLIKEKTPNKILPFLEKYFSETIYEQSSEKIKYYYHHYYAIAFLYRGNLNKVVSELLQAREYTKYISKTGRGIIIENSLMVLMVYLLKDESRLIPYEKEKLRKNLKKQGFIAPGWRDIAKSTDRIESMPQNKRKLEVNKLVDALINEFKFLYLLDTDQLAEILD